MRYLFLALFVIVAASGQPTHAQENTCPGGSAFVTEGARGSYQLDLLCQPVIFDTLEIEPDVIIRVTVDLTSYRTATDQTSVTFNIHLAMARARLLITGVGEVGGREVMDSQSIIMDVPIETGETTYTFTIENRGARSAIFDLSVRPQRIPATTMAVDPQIQVEEPTESTSTETATELSFSGDAATVIGPVTIPAGVYRVTAKTTGFMIVQVSPLGGECGAGTSSLSPMLFGLFEAQATSGAEAIFTSKECSALIEASNITAPWTLEFEQLG